MAPKRYTLPKAHQTLIEKAIHDLYAKAKARFLGIHPEEKGIVFARTPDFSLPGLFVAVARGEGIKANSDTLDALIRIAELYMDGARDRTKANAIKSVTKALGEVKGKSQNRTEFKKAVEKELTNVWKTAASQMKAIVEVETQTTKNISVLEGILRVNDDNAIQDPVIYFIVVKDKDLCDECRRIHLMPDGVTPRLWFMSEVGHGYHKKGEENPKIGGLHPHCRCSILTMLPGYTFNGAGRLAYKARGWLEIDAQRGKQVKAPAKSIKAQWKGAAAAATKKVQKSESELVKGDTKYPDLKREFARYGWSDEHQGGNHVELKNPKYPEMPGPQIKRSHMNGPISQHWTKEYGLQVGLKLDNTRKGFEPNDKASGKTKQDYEGHYRRAGYVKPPLDEKGQPQMNTWHPDTKIHGAYTHIPTDQIEFPQIKEDWKPDYLATVLGSKAAPQVGPITVSKHPDGKFRVVDGHHRYAGAFISNMSHVPAKVI